MHTQLLKNRNDGEVDEVILRYNYQSQTLVVCKGVMGDEEQFTTEVHKTSEDSVKSVVNTLKRLGFKENIEDVLDKPNSFEDYTPLPSFLVKGEIDSVRFPCYVDFVDNLNFFHYKKGKLYHRNGKIESIVDEDLDYISECCNDCGIDLIFTNHDRDKPRVIDLALPSMKLFSRKAMYHEAEIENQLGYFIEDREQLDILMFENQDSFCLVRQPDSNYEYGKNAEGNIYLTNKNTEHQYELDVFTEVKKQLQTENEQRGASIRGLA